MPGLPAIITEVKKVTKMVKDIGAPQVCRDRGSHRSTLPWLVPDAIHKEQTSQVGKGSGSGVTLPGFLFQLHHSLAVYSRASYSTSLNLNFPVF